MKKLLLLFFLSLLVNFNLYAGDVITTDGQTDAIQVDTSGNVTIVNELTISGAEFITSTTVSAATYNVLATDSILYVTRTATGDCVITLPTAQVVAGRTITIKDIGGAATFFTTTVDTQGAETIDNNASIIFSGGATRQLYCDGTNWKVLIGHNAADLNRFKISRQITGNYNFDPLTDSAIDCSLLSGNATITIPEATTLPLDAIVRSCWVFNNSPYIVTIQLSGNNVFRSGSSKITLRDVNDSALIGGSYRAGGVIGWIATTKQKIICQASRTTTWAAANFSSSTAIPLATTVLELDDEIIDHDSVTNNTRITVKKDGVFGIAYKYDIDSTGGATYTINTKIMKNGSDEIATFTTRTGNYSNEDQSGSLPTAYAELDEDDYIELEIDQNNLTGNLVNALLIVTTES